MKSCDIAIIGGSTTGSWFARQMAQRGHKVLLLEKEERDNVSRQYDIVHMGKSEMEQFGLHIPREGDSDFGFYFNGSPAYSPYGNYPKMSDNPEMIIGLHKHEYIVKMQDSAANAGAEVLTGAAFTGFIRDKGGKIAGVKYKDASGEHEVLCKIAADCSGIPSVARTMLPDTSTVENFKLTNKDLFHVVLYYILYSDKAVNPGDYHGFFLNYKSWSAPCGNEHGAILGIGGSYGYDYAEAIFEDFKKNYKLPDYTVEKIERWVTPYHRAIYSFVDDGFIAMGDAACLTKPNNGEGCTSSLVQGAIAVETIDRLLKANQPLSKENLWTINKQYVEKQGTSFESLRPMLMGFVAPDYDEAEYLFSKDLLYCKKILASDGQDMDLTTRDILKMVGGVVKAVAAGKIKIATVKKLAVGIANGSKVTALYKNYPSSPRGYPEWKVEADKLWKKAGSVCDTCNKQLLKKLGYE